MYGFSKHLFDLWVWKQGLLDQVAGLKFFNVFGPNEWHKDDMRSVVCKAFEQIQSTGKLKLFRSHRPDIGDGEQKRDFVYVKDCAALVFWLLIRPEVCGIFNVGTGRARSFNELGRAVFKALHKDANMVYVDMPMELQGKYQYYTKADMGKLVRAGFDGSFTPLEDAVKDYVRNHLLPGYRHLDAGTENSDQTLGTAS
jgi:ADP-L-glycero-D-manno-heptose 6-epimerase